MCAHRRAVDEVRALGRLLSIPNHLVQRHPFPGPGLAIRILGPVTREQVKILQQADNIYIEEIRKANLYDQISQAFAVLLPVKAVGVMGDARTYEQVIALRAVQSEDFMTADWFVFPAEVLRRISSRITNEVQGINRVTYDISSKPPAVRGPNFVTERGKLIVRVYADGRVAVVACQTVYKRALLPASGNIERVHFLSTTLCTVGDSLKHHGHNTGCSLK